VRKFNFLKHALGKSDRETNQPEKKRRIEEGSKKKAATVVPVRGGPDGEWLDLVNDIKEQIDKFEGRGDFFVHFYRLIIYY
jgi:hypothetical protein